MRTSSTMYWVLLLSNVFSLKFHFLSMDFMHVCRFTLTENFFTIKFFFFVWRKSCTELLANKWKCIWAETTFWVGLQFYYHHLPERKSRLKWCFPSEMCDEPIACLLKSEETARICYLGTRAKASMWHATYFFIGGSWKKKCSSIHIRDRWSYVCACLPVSVRPLVSSILCAKMHA